MTRRIFHIDLDAFFVAVEQALDPELKGKAVVVGGRGWRGVVASASYEARRFGIHAGMPLSQAHRRCPRAIFLEGRFSRYEEASERFLAILARYTPFIEVGGIDEAYLDMTGFESLYGPALEAARRMKGETLRELGLTASVGIASTKIGAKVASDYGKPDGLVEVAEGGEAAFLAPLPVGALPGVGPRAEERLKGLGVESIGALAALPQPWLRRLFGAWGDLLHRWARGIDPSPLSPPPAAKSISRSTTLMEDTLDLPFLEGVLGYLTEKVAMELWETERLARGVRLALRYHDFETLHRQRVLPCPTCWPGTIFEAARELLHIQLRHRPAPVRLVGVGVFQLGEGGQLPLWDEGEGRREGLRRAIAQVRAKYGFTALQTGRTFQLREFLPTEVGDYVLQTPALSR